LPLPAAGLPPRWTGTETGTASLSARPHGHEGVPVTRHGRSELASGAGRAAALTGNEGVGGSQTPKRFLSACQWLLDPPSSDSGIVALKVKSRSRRTHGYATRPQKTSSRTYPRRTELNAPT